MRKAKARGRAHTFVPDKASSPNSAAAEVMSAPADQPHDTSIANARSPQSLPLIRSTPRPSDIPLSFAQVQWTPPSHVAAPTDRIPICVRLRGWLNVAVLERAIVDTIARHEILRTRYVTGLSGLRQEIDPPTAFSLAFLPLRGAPEEKQLQAIWEHLNSFYCAPIRLDSNVLNLTLYELGDGDYILAGVIHHIAFDGTSLKIFWTEIVHSYRTFVLGLRRDDAPPLQYADFALWESNWLTKTELCDADSFWRTHLRGSSGQHDRQQDIARATDTEEFALQFSGETFAQISSHARARRTTICVIFTGALLAALSHMPKVGRVLSHVVRGRPPRLMNSIGCFMQIRAIAVNAHALLSFDDVVEATHKGLKETSELRRPLAKTISEEFGLGQALLNYTVGDPGPDPMKIFSTLGLSGSSFRLPRELDTRPGRDIQFIAQQRPDGLYLKILYDPHRFARVEVAGLAKRIVAIVRRGCETPQGPWRLMPSLAEGD